MRHRGLRHRGWGSALALAIWVILLAGCSVDDRKEELRLEGITIFEPDQEISALYDDGEKLWVAGREGIFWLNRNNGELICRLDSDIQMIYASDMCETMDGLIWAGHNKGVSAFSKKGEEVYHLEEPQIPGGRVNTLALEGESLWVGTMEGAARLAKSGDQWQVQEILNEESGLTDPCVNCIVRVGDETWFGAYLAAGRGGLSIHNDNGEWQCISVDEGLPHRYVNAILPISENQVLVGCGHLNLGGMAELVRDPDGLWKVGRTWGRQNGIPGDKVRWLYRDTDGYLWITTESEGILLCDSLERLEQDPIGGLVLTAKNGLSNNEIKVIVENDDYIWLGSRMGLNRIEKSYMKSRMEQGRKEGS